MDGPDQIYFLVFFADQLSDLVFRHCLVGSLLDGAESHFVYALKALLQVLLDFLWLLRFSQQLNQVLVRKEEEAREVVSLRFQVLIQVLLNIFELVV